MASQHEGIDPRGPRFGQALTGTISLLAFVLEEPLLVAALATVLGFGAVGGYRVNLWAQLFKRLVKPRLDPPGEREHPDPPRFAMCLGFLFLSSAAIVLLALGPFVTPWIGWALVLTVAGLALLAAVSGLCIGCELYVRIQRLRRGRDREVTA